MDVIECIRTRRSVRGYSDRDIEPALINKLIEAGAWAPSGKNCQPWRFKMVSEKKEIDGISRMSVCEKWMRTAPCFICVFLDKEKSYNYMKDVQSCGAAIQNILLCAHALGMGSCWIGEILNKSEAVCELLKVDAKRYELMALLTVGYYSHKEMLNVERRRDNDRIRI